MHIEIWSHYGDGRYSDSHMKTVIYKEGDKIDIQNSTVEKVSAIPGENDERPPDISQREISWDDGRQIYRKTRFDLGGTIESAIIFTKKIHAPIRSQAPFLFGYLIDKEHYSDVLIGSTNLSVSADAVGGAACDLIEGSCPDGKYRVWIDQTEARLLRKAEIIQRSPNLDIEEGKTLIQRTTTISDVVSGETNGYSYIAKMKKTVEKEFEDGSVVVDGFTAAVTSMDTDPDFDSTAFVMDFPEGAIVSDLDFGIEYTWSGGKAVVRTPTPMVESIPNLAADALKNPEQYPEATRAFLQESDNLGNLKPEDPNPSTEWIPLFAIAALSVIFCIAVLVKVRRSGCTSD
jgi:hypothetical protein